MFEHETTTRVRYGETDQMSYVYYGNYALYYEIGRVEAIRSLGYTYKKMEQEGVIMPVKKMEVTYLRPVFYDELITIKTIIQKMPDRDIVFRTEIYNEKKELANVGIVTLVFYDPVKKETTTAPQFLYNKLKEHILTK